MPQPELTEVIREQVLAALRGILNPTGHTDACFELRAYGVRKCTKACERIRAAIEALAGDAPPNPNWPEGDQGLGGLLILNLPHNQNFSDRGKSDGRSS